MTDIEGPARSPGSRKYISRRTLLIGSGTVLGMATAGLELGSLAQRASASTGPWGGYSNGQIPLSALSTVNYPGVVPYGFPGSLSAVYLKPDAAAGLLAMLHAYHAAVGGYLGVNEGYRTLAGQQYWWDYYGHNPSMGAYPGTSNHGWGEAFDLESPTDAQVNWVVAYGSAYGFTPIHSEDWHFDYSGSFAYTPQGDPVPFASSKQYSPNVTLTSSFQNLSGADVAGGAGGSGYYDIVGSFYVNNLLEGQQVELIAYIHNASSGAVSSGYSQFIDGNASGTAHASAPWRLQVPAGSNVYVKARAVSGSPVMQLWGVQILNFPI